LYSKSLKFIFKSTELFYQQLKVILNCQLTVMNF